MTSKGLCNNYQEGGADKLELSSINLDSTPPPKQKKLVLTPLCYVKNNVAPPPPPPPPPTQDLHKVFAKYRVLTTLAQNRKRLKPERERSREKNQRTGD